MSDSNAKFLEFHNQNPNVYKTLVLKCKQWRNKYPNGVCGIAMMWESMRWDMMMRTTGDDWKLNNNHKAHYARLIMNANPELDGIFNLRESR